MKKSKRKKNNVPQKDMAAQEKNYFLSNLKGLFHKITGSDDVFKLIPKGELDRIYLTRFRPIKVKAGLNQKIPNCVLQYCKEQIKNALNLNSININIGSLEKITYYEYCSIGYTIIRYHAFLLETDYKGASEVIVALNDFSKKLSKEIDNEVLYKFSFVSEELSIVLSDIQYEFCIIKNIKVEEPTYVGYVIEIHELQTEKKNIILDGEKRIAHKLGWPKMQPNLQKQEFKIEYVTVAPEKLGLKQSTELDVYIQNHALMRLRERMDDINIGLLQFNMIESIKSFNVFRNNDGQILIEYRIFGAKTGYFLAEIIDEILLIKTFLFLTNNGTPEGDKLYKSTRLMKEDKKYLEIDKISAFINSDIELNAELKQVFVEAGCQGLFTIDKSLYMGEVENQKKLAERLSKHMNLGTE